MQSLTENASKWPGIRIEAEVGLRPQDRFRNPKGYLLTPDLDTLYCSFRVSAPLGSGVYFWLVDNEIVYIGRAKSLYHRLTQQYGRVSPRHPYSGGQLQKCRINALICAAVGEGRIVTVLWEETEDYARRELQLLSEIRPIWNRRL